MKRFILFLLLLSFSFPGVGDEKDKTDIVTIYLVRHAEKQLEASDNKNPPLTPCGEKRAQDLAFIFKDIPLSRVYSSNFERTLNTARPTASALGLEIEIYEPRELETFSKKLLDHSEDTLVVGHGPTTPALAELLSDKKLNVSMADKKRYDRIYQVVVANGAGRVHILHQTTRCDT